MAWANKSSFVVINVDLPLMLTFNPNPRSVDFTTKKVHSKTQTLGGWVFEHRGAEPDIMRVAGSTAAIIDVQDKWLGVTVTRQEKVETQLIQLQQLVKLDKERTIDFLKAWQKRINTGINRGLSTINRVISNGNKASITNDTPDVLTLARTFIYYKGTIYKGFFDSFHYVESVDDPRRYTYDFVFVVVQSSTDWIIGQLLLTNSVLQKTLNSALAPLTIGKVRAVAP